jgi:hypothetical protein
MLYVELNNIPQMIFQHNCKALLTLKISNGTKLEIRENPIGPNQIHLM